MAKKEKVKKLKFKASEIDEILENGSKWSKSNDGLTAKVPVKIPELTTNPHSIWLGEQIHVQDIGSTLGYSLERMPHRLRSVIFTEYDQSGSTIKPRDVIVEKQKKHTIYDKVYSFNKKETIEFTLPPTDKNYIMNGIYLNLEIRRDFDAKVTVKHQDDLMRKFIIPADAGNIYNFPFSDFAEMAVYKGEVFTIKIEGIKKGTLGGQIIDGVFTPELYADVQEFSFDPLITQNYLNSKLGNIIEYKKESLEVLGDCNDTTESGIYRISKNTKNIPENSLNDHMANAKLRVTYWNGNMIMQEFLPTEWDVVNGKIPPVCYRFLSGNSWTNWQRIAVANDKAFYFTSEARLRFDKGIFKFEIKSPVSDEWEMAGGIGE